MRKCCEELKVVCKRLTLRFRSLETKLILMGLSVYLQLEVEKQSQFPKLKLKLQICSLAEVSSQIWSKQVKIKFMT